MKISELIVSKYLKKEDFKEPTALTVLYVTKEDVARPGATPEKKAVMFFRGEAKGMVLNPTNLKRAARIFGSDEVDDWIGKKIVVFHDKDVEYAGDIIGGLRLRAPDSNSIPRESENPADFVRDLSDIRSDPI